MENALEIFYVKSPSQNCGQTAYDSDDNRFPDFFWCNNVLFLGFN